MNILIPVRSIIGTTLNSRDETVKLFGFALEQYTKGSNFVFEFHGVDFMSRSFADQFHKEQTRLSKEYNTTFEIDNASVQIIEILHAVAKTQNGGRVYGTRKFDSISFTDPNHLYDFLKAV